MSGIIGVSAPARLLREEWDSPRQLAEELYAMFTAKGPVEIDSTVTIRVPEGQPALRIERVREGDTNNTAFQHGIVKNAAAPAPVPTRRAARFNPDTDPRRHITGLNDAEGQAAIREGRPTPRTPARGWVETPIVEIAGPVSFTGDSPVRFSQAPVMSNPRTGRQEDLADVVANRVQASATSVDKPAFGKVVSGTGAEYIVNLFPNGPGKETTGAVSVRIPFIADTEAIEPGTWLTGIQKFDDGYWCQPPVWMP